MAVELTPVRLGMVRLTDAAPVVLAQAAGLFAAEGLAVSITVEPSWANVADKLAWGMLEGAVMLPPLVIAMSLGLRGPVTDLIVPAGISLNGNGITLGNAIAAPILAEGRPGPAEAASRLKDVINRRQPLRLAVVHAFSTHDLLLRLFLERGGIDPAQTVISVVPPSEMPAALATRQIDGFCAGAPWGAVAAEAGAGRLVAVTSEIWPDHPEKCLAVRVGWANANALGLQALLRALLQAGRRCDDPMGAQTLATLLLHDERVGVPARLIEASLPGGDSHEVNRSVFAAGGAQMPKPSDARWFAAQMGRWRVVPGDSEIRAAALYRADPHLAAASTLPQV